MLPMLVYGSSTKSLSNMMQLGMGQSWGKMDDPVGLAGFAA